MEHLFILLFAICISLVKCLERSLAHFLIGFVFLLLILLSISLDNNLLSDVCFADIFSQSVMSPHSIELLILMS